MNTSMKNQKKKIGVDPGETATRFYFSFFFSKSKNKKNREKEA
jgi:hypothetical protein